MSTFPVVTITHAGKSIQSISAHTLLYISGTYEKICKDICKDGEPPNVFPIDGCSEKSIEVIFSEESKKCMETLSTCDGLLKDLEPTVINECMELLTYLDIRIKLFSQLTASIYNSVTSDYTMMYLLNLYSYDDVEANYNVHVMGIRTQKSFFIHSITKILSRVGVKSKGKEGYTYAAILLGKYTLSCNKEDRENNIIELTSPSLSWDKLEIFEHYFFDKFVKDLAIHSALYKRSFLLTKPEDVSVIQIRQAMDYIYVNDKNKTTCILDLYREHLEKALRASSILVTYADIYRRKRKYNFFVMSK